MIDFTNIEYLKDGNEKQQLAFKEIKELNLFQLLKDYNPLLAGTIPIEIDLPNSDLDIICQCKDHVKFKKLLVHNYGHMHGFHFKSSIRNNMETSVAVFETKHFIIEIFAQNIDSEKQNAFRHMLIEHNIIETMGTTFRNRIIDLKRNGLKTEPAFAKLLGFKGDPYKALLELS